MDNDGVLVVGGSGFLGSHLMRLLGERGVGTYFTKPILGGIKFDASSQRLLQLRDQLPGGLKYVVIPFGAIDMEGCAKDPAATSKINIISTIEVIEDVFSLGLKPIFISTDYVFGGEKELWAESDFPQPKMAYGAQKLAVEAWLGTRKEQWLVARLSKVVSDEIDTHSMIGQWVNEIKSGKSFSCADDQFFSPAYVGDLAQAIISLIDVDANGLFHVAGPQRFSRIELLRLLVAEIQKIDPTIAPQIVPCSLHELPFLEKRPFDTSLAISKLQSTIKYDFCDMQSLCAAAAQRHFSKSG